MNRVSRILRSGLFTLALLLLTAAPAQAGVIQIDFTANVINAGGPLGARGDAFVGLIRIDLIDFPDRRPTPQVATFADGPIFGTDLGLADAVTFDLFPVGGTPSFDREDSVVVAIEDLPGGDRLNVFVRTNLSPGDSFDELSFVVEGTSDLFAGALALDENLAGIEALLLSFDFDQANPGPGFNLTSTVTSNIGPGVPDFSNIGSMGSNEETVLLINSASITLLPEAITDVPEPGQLGMLAFGLWLVRNRGALKPTASIG